MNMQGHQGFVQDQQMLTWIRSTAEQYENEVMQETLSDTIYPELVQIYTGMNPNADILRTMVGQPGVGRMVPLANAGMDFPNVSQSMREISVGANSFVCGYMWTTEEIRKARYMGVNLEMDRVRLAYEVAEREKERFVCHGDEVQQWYGLFTHTYPDAMYLHIEDADGNTPANLNANVGFDGTFINGTTSKAIRDGGPWAIGDSHRAYTDISRMFVEMRQNSRDMLMADTLLMSVDKEAFLLEPYRVTDTGIMEKSVLEYLRMNNPYTAHTGMPMRIKTVYDLPHGTCVLYNSSMQTMRFILAEDLTFMGPQQWGYEIRFFGKLKLAGIQYLRPKNICYLRGI